MAAPAKPSERYEAALQEGRISEDRAQRAALERLDALAAALQAPAPAPGLLDRLRLRGRAPQAPLQGLYLWGGVGRGKTFLMDLFFDALPPGVGERVHFYRFMRGVHEALKAKFEGKTCEGEPCVPFENVEKAWGANDEACTNLKDMLEQSPEEIAEQIINEIVSAISHTLINFL